MTFDRKSIGILISRVLGIYVLVTALQYFPMMSSFYLSPEFDQSRFSVVVIAGFFLHLIISYVLLVHAPRVAEFLVSETQTGTATGKKLDPETIAGTAFVVIGVTLVLRGLPTFAEQFTLRMSGVHGGPASDALLVGLGVQVLIGLYLILGRKGLLELLRKVRQ